MGAVKPPFVIPNVEGWQGWTVLGLIGFMLVALVMELAPPYLVMMGTLVVLLALSILDVSAAFHGFADEAMLSVAVLFVVAKGIEQSGGLEYVASVLFRTPDKSKAPRLGGTPIQTEGSIVWVLLKFSVPVAIFSAFLANIPLVAMMIPPIVQFGNKVNLPPSKMLMPLSYAAQLGGTMTLIGAGTNLVVLSMAAQKIPDLHMSLFEIGIVGVPITITGIFYIIAFSGKLLPDRVANQPTTLNPREYTAVLVIKEGSKIARKSIEMSGLGRQPGLNLLAISRDTETISNPTSDVILQPKDHLHFVGVIDAVLLLVQLNGLILTEDEGQGEVDLNRLKANQILVEAVIASGSSMVQKRIADLQCRTRFNTVIAAIHRHGKRLSSVIGDIKVEAGDCLLMVADSSDFIAKHRNNSHFALVSQLPGFKPINRKKAVLASIFVVAMVVASGAGMKLITAALFSSAGLLLTKCLTPRDAMDSIELPVLIMIAAAFGIAEGMVESGAASILAKALMGLAGKSMVGLISCTYMATTLFSLAITNSAAVTIMFPVALAAANHQALDFRPFAYTLMMGASAGFMTPTASPTNLMVYAPGSYKFSDYIHYGGPLQLLLLFVTVGVTMSGKYWWVWVIVILALTCGATPLLARHKSTQLNPAAVAVPETKSIDAESGDENFRAALNAGGTNSSTFMLAPGHDNHDSVSRRTSQSTFPATSSPGSSFLGPSSPFPPPYRLEDSEVPTVGFSPSRTSRTMKDTPFPPPYRLEESSVLSVGFSSESESPRSLSAPSPDSRASSSYPQATPVPSTATAQTRNPQERPIPKKAKPAASSPTGIAPKPAPPQPTPFRTRQPLRETSSYSTPPLASSSMRPPSPLPYDSMDLEGSSSSSFQAFGGKNSSLDMEAFTDVRISGSPEGVSVLNVADADFPQRGYLSPAGMLSKPPPSDSSSPRAGMMSKRPPSNPSSALGGLLSKIATSNASSAPGGLLSKRPPSNASADPGGRQSSMPLSGDASAVSEGQSSKPAPVDGPRATCEDPPSKPSPSYLPVIKYPGQPRKASPSPDQPGKASPSPWPSPQKPKYPSPTRRTPTKEAASRKTTNFFEEDLTGGISDLLASRRLSSLKDTSAFADNTTTH